MAEDDAFCHEKSKKSVKPQTLCHFELTGLAWKIQAGTRQNLSMEVIQSYF